MEFEFCWFWVETRGVVGLGCQMAFRYLPVEEGEGDRGLGTQCKRKRQRRNTRYWSLALPKCKVCVGPGSPKEGRGGRKPGREGSRALWRRSQRRLRSGPGAAEGASDEVPGPFESGGLGRTGEAGAGPFGSGALTGKAPALPERAGRDQRGRRSGLTTAEVPAPALGSGLLPQPRPFPGPTPLGRWRTRNGLRPRRRREPPP